MALDAEGHPANVKYSIERYLNGTCGSSYTFHWEGTPAENTEDEFIQEQLLNFSGGMYHRQVEEGSTNIQGETVPVMLSLNIFVKKTKTTKTNRHFEIRDDVLHHIHEGKTFNMFDYVGGNTSSAIAVLKFRDVVTDIPVPDPDYHQWNLTVEFDWLRKW